MTNIKDAILSFLVDVGVQETIANILLILVSVIVWILLGIVINLIVGKTVKRILRVTKENQRALTLARLITSIVRYVVWFIVILIILAELNVDITPIIASAGVLGLAVGFGSQEMVKDFIAGFFIIFESIFNVGDVIEVQGFKGNVTSIGLRSTVITNWKGEVKTVSNGDISSCINFSKNDSLAIVDFGVAYDTDLNNLKTVVEAELENFKSKYEDMIELPQFLGVTELASSSINLRLIAKTKKMKHFAIERGLRKDLVELCEKNNIEIPFPQVVIHNAKN